MGGEVQIALLEIWETLSAREDRAQEVEEQIADLKRQMDSLVPSGDYESWEKLSVRLDVLTALKATMMRSEKPSWEGRVLRFRGHKWSFRDQPDSLLLEILDGLESAAWPDYLKIEDNESRIREAAKYLRRKTEGVLYWGASADQIRWSVLPTTEP